MRFMFSLMFLCFSLGVPTAHAQSTGETKEQPFHISSKGSGFGVQGEFEGTYRVTNDSVEVYVSKGTLYVSEHCPYQGRRRINYIKFGLGTQGESSWKVENNAFPWYLNVIMSPREEYPLSELHFSLPREGILDLAKRWLVVQIEAEALDVPADQMKKGYSYVHSCEHIFIKPADEIEGQKKPCKKL